MSADNNKPSVTWALRPGSKIPIHRQDVTGISVELNEICATVDLKRPRRVCISMVSNPGVWRNCETAFDVTDLTIDFDKKLVIASHDNDEYKSYINPANFSVVAVRAKRSSAPTA